jgi:branched-subunit amino acid aminotransferase/4-amino-4-deoxychorismate lyase
MALIVDERDIHLKEIKEAREAFITSSTKRLIPVRQLDDTIFSLREKDSVTERLWKSFLSLEATFT